MKVELAQAAAILGEDNPVIISALDEDRRAEQELTDWLDRYPDIMNGWKHVQSARRQLRRAIAEAEYTMKHAANCKLRLQSRRDK